jgi:hypothetical protein
MRYAVDGDSAAGWAVLVFIFLYSPAYNIGMPFCGIGKKTT